MVLFVTILFITNAVLLIAIVLIQQPKTAGGLFSGTGQSLLGTSGKSFWTKFTTILAGTFMVLCLLMSFVHRFEQAPSSITGLIEKQQQQAAAPAQAAVPAPAGQKPQPNGNPVQRVPGNTNGASANPGSTKP